MALFEAVWALSRTYAFRSLGASGVIERLLDLDGLALQDAAVIARALEDYRASSADFSDCLLLALARREDDLPLATFDAKLARLDGVRKLGGRAAR